VFFQTIATTDALAGMVHLYETTPFADNNGIQTVFRIRFRRYTGEITGVLAQ